MLTISSNGAGRDYTGGHARLEPRTYRIDNDGGAWAGSGERVLALSVDQLRPLINHESMVLFGEGGYEGLVAYVFIELANEAPELEAVILDVEMAPLPDPIEARERRDIPEPQAPTAHSEGPAAFGTPNVSPRPGRGTGHRPCSSYSRMTPTGALLPSSSSSETSLAPTRGGSTSGTGWCTRS